MKKLVFAAQITIFRPRSPTINNPQGILMVWGVAGAEKCENDLNFMIFMKFSWFFIKIMIFHEISCFWGKICTLREKRCPRPILFLRKYWWFHARGRKCALGPKNPKIQQFGDFMEIYKISMKLAKFHLFGRQNCISSPRPPKPQYSLWNINGSGHDFSPRNAIFT